MSRKLNGILLTALLVVMSLAISLQAQSRGDVTVHFNAGADLNKVISGEVNTMELWIRNQGPLYGLSLGFKFTSTIPGFFWLSPYGNKPSLQGCPYVQEYGDAVGKFDLGGLQLKISELNDSIWIGGTALNSPIPAHSVNTKLYDMKLVMPAGDFDDPCGFTVDNIFYPLAGTWSFDEGAPIGQYAPTFNGQADNSPEDPSAPQLCFELLKRPCKGLIWTSVPPPDVYLSHCENFGFDFDASGTPPYYYNSTWGSSIDQSTGQYSLNYSDRCDTAMLVVVSVLDQSPCHTSIYYGFTMHWTNSVPIFTDCPIVQGRLGVHQTYEYPFNAVDQNPCDNIQFALSPVGTPPTGSYQVNSNGLVIYTPALADSTNTYQFELIATDNLGATSTCQFSVNVSGPGCGDADGSGNTPDISDCVYLIDFIFSGGMPPHPPVAGDADGSGGPPDISDVVFLIGCIFGGTSCPYVCGD